MRGWWVLLWAAGMTASLWGQSTQATLSGRVVDSVTGSAVGTARVRCAGADGESREALVSPEGTFRLADLSPGVYLLEAEAQGYQPRQVDEISLPVGGLVDVDVRVRPLSDVWEAGLRRAVLPDGGRAVLRFIGPDLDASRLAWARTPRVIDGGFEPSSSDTVSMALLRTLPLAGRDAYTLLVTLAGVTADAGTARGLGVSAHGQRASASAFRLDGVDNNNDLLTGPLMTAPPEALSEYRLSTGIFMAEFGGTAGVLANALSQPGGRQWHGLAYVYGNHEAVNANTLERNRRGLARAQDAEWQPGWSAGGPLGSAWQASAAGEFYRRRTQEDPGEYLLPTRNYPRFLLPNGAGRNLLDRFPAPFADLMLVNAPVTLRPPVSLERQFLLGRLDRVKSGARSRQAVRWMEARFRRPDFVWSPYPDFQSTLRQPARSVVAMAVTDLSPGLRHDGRVAWSRQGLGWDRPYPEIPTLEALDGTLLPGSPAFYAFDHRQTRVETNHFVSWGRGAHHWKMGGSVAVRDLGTQFGPGRDGRFVFDSFLGDFGAGQPTSAEVLVARASLPRLDRATTPHRFRQVSGNWFVQDTLRVTPRVALHGGVRYEYYGSPEQRSGPRVELLNVPSGGGMRDARLQPATRLLPVDGNDFALRAGLSWRVTGQGSTFVFGSYGIFHDRLFDNLWQNLTLNSLILRTAFVSQFALRGELPTVEEAVSSGVAFNRDFPEVLWFQPGLRTPYVQSYSAGLRRFLGMDWQVEAGVRGALGRKLLITDKRNRPLEDPFSANGRVNPELPMVNYRANQGSSSFHALAVTLRYRGRKIAAQAAYTWSHAIDNQSDALSGDFFDLSFARQDFQAGQIVTPSFSIAGDPRIDRGSADFDQRHNLVGWAIVPLPLGIQVAALGAARSGFPYSVFAPNDNAPLIYNRRADLIAANDARARQTSEGVAMLDRRAFGIPDDGKQGSLGRNAMAGPGFVNMDLSVSKTFALPGSEARRLVVRADAFNAFNHLNLRPPVNQLDAADFGIARRGRVGRTGFPALAPFREIGRRIQLMLQVHF